MDQKDPKNKGIFLFPVRKPVHGITGTRMGVNPKRWKSQDSRRADALCALALNKRNWLQFLGTPLSLR